MPYACKFCLAAKGLKGSEVHKLPKTYEECADHIERDHGYPIPRQAESPENAHHRVMRLKPERAYTRSAAQVLEELMGQNIPLAASLIETSGAIAHVTLLERSGETSIA